MWLARLLGIREGDDSEPSQVPPHPLSAGRRALTPAPVAAGVRTRAMQKSKGFDPYNSGAFRKASAWERVNRR